MPRVLRRLVALTLAAGVPAAGAAAGSLSAEPGRNDVRVWSGPYPLGTGRTVREMALPERLESRGYTRVHEKPDRPGEYFWGREIFWIHRHAYDDGAHTIEAELLGLRLDPADGRVTEVLREPASWPARWLGGGDLPALEPRLLGEAFGERRAPRRPIHFAALPERVWRPLLAAEDSRFFDHIGLDGIAIARAVLANLERGGVAQGGSTLTQQLVKLRDLSPRRSLGRKASEALRALALEAEYSKEEILEAYLDHVYYGHVDGVHLYGLGAAARAYWGREPEALSLAQAAALAALVQSPNRMSPVRNPEQLRPRYEWVLDRLADLGWADAGELAAARRGLPALDLHPPAAEPAMHYRRWLGQLASERAPERAEEGRGFLVRGTLDPVLQDWAEEAVARGLADLERREPALRRRPLAAALVALDATTGDVLAYVGGPAGSELDRARAAERQPGSTVKPLVALQALERCGSREPVYPSRRVLDTPLTLELPSGPWSPQNSDRRYRDIVTVRQALVESLNVPTVRLARWCGFRATAETLRDAGLALPSEPPPSFVLGAVETTPLDLAAAYTTFAAAGRAARPRPILRLSRPSGARLLAPHPSRHRVASASATYLVTSLLEEVVDGGPEGSFGKTGTSSERRDAWFAGGAGSVVAAVWVGLDDGAPLGFVGSQAAEPIWRRFMERAAPARPPLPRERPDGVVEWWVQESTGLRVRDGRAGSEPYLFRRRYLPPKRRWWREDPAQRPIP
ncbi:MAG: transglycosylase domain-containing protein [Thermoanaerobaculia bacterium]